MRNACLKFAVGIVSLVVSKNWKLFCLSTFLPFYLSTFSFCQDFSGEIGDVKGKVEILTTGETEWMTVVEKMPVRLKDRLKTAANSSCNLDLDDGSIIYIGENSETSVETLELTGEKHNSKIALWFGRIVANISKLKETKMAVHSPTAVVAVRGTEFAVECSTDEKTDVGVFDGEVSVKNAVATDSAVASEVAVVSESTVAVVGVAPANAVSVSTDVVKATDVAEEVIVKPDQETSVQKGGRPLAPSRIAIMAKYKERNAAIKDRVAKLRERLKRVSPEERTKMRQAAIDRFQKIKSNRLEQKERIKQKRQPPKREVER